MTKLNLRKHHDDSYIDEIRLRTVPRYKDSDISGDEWRTSVVIEFMRKGQVVFSDHRSNMDYATAAVPYLAKTFDQTDRFKLLTDEFEQAVCQQPGCKEPPTHRYAYKRIQVHPSTRHREVFVPELVNPDNYDHPAHALKMKDPGILGRPHIWFCDAHKTRGDAGLEDADDNYDELIDATDAIAAAKAAVAKHAR